MNDHVLKRFISKINCVDPYVRHLSVPVYTGHDYSTEEVFVIGKIRVMFQPTDHLGPLKPVRFTGSQHGVTGGTRTVRALQHYDWREKVSLFSKSSASTEKHK